MFNVGGGEFLLIALVALLVLGPDKLPDFARKSARILGQLRSMSQGFQNEMRGVMKFDDTDTPTTSRGPRLVGSVDDSSTPTVAGDTPSGDATGSGTRATPPDSAAGDRPAPSIGTEPGNDGNTSGTSAA